MLVTDRTLAGGGDGLVAAVRDAVAGGVNVVQVREKDLPAVEQAALARRIVDAVHGRALVVVNASPAAALAAGADGVHCPEYGLPVGTVRRAAGERLLVGRSVHSLESALAPDMNGADYLVLGTVFSSASHPGGPTGGIGLVRQVTRRAPCPVIAIGGITRHNAGSVVRAGAAGVAVISAILAASDPLASAKDLRTALQRVDAALPANGECA
jgi:thiamine-phosphate pyrophosphorylase